MNERQSRDPNRGATNAGSATTHFCVFEGDVTANERQRFESQRQLSLAILRYLSRDFAHLRWVVGGLVGSDPSRCPRGHEANASSGTQSGALRNWRFKKPRTVSTSSSNPGGLSLTKLQEARVANWPYGRKPPKTLRPHSGKVFPQQRANLRRFFCRLAHQNCTIAVASDFRADGAKSPEFPQKEGVLGSEIAARNRRSLATFHRTLKSQCSIAFSCLGNRCNFWGPRWASQ